MGKKMVGRLKFVLRICVKAPMHSSSRTRPACGMWGTPARRAQRVVSSAVSICPDFTFTLRVLCFASAALWCEKVRKVSFVRYKSV